MKSHTATKFVFSIVKTDMTEAAPKMNRMLRNELVFYILMVAVCVDCISELVRRRHAGDVFQNYNSSTRFTCNEGNNLTYLVNEGQCKNQQELLNGSLWIFIHVVISYM